MLVYLETSILPIDTTKSLSSDSMIKPARALINPSRLYQVGRRLFTNRSKNATRTTKPLYETCIGNRRSLQTPELENESRSEQAEAGRQARQLCLNLFQETTKSRANAIPNFPNASEKGGIVSTVTLRMTNVTPHINEVVNKAKLPDKPEYLSPEVDLWTVANLISFSFVS